MFVKIVSLMFIFFINYHVVDIIEYVNYFTCLCRMMMKYCEEHAILDMAFLDPMTVIEALVTKKHKETENYIVYFFLKHQKK
jgi:hypothetical protein